MNIPNKLTVLRVILVPIFMALYLIPSHVAFSIFSFEVTYGRLLAVIIFILASVTDWADILPEKTVLLQILGNLWIRLRISFS